MGVGVYERKSKRKEDWFSPAQREADAGLREAETKRCSVRCARAPTARLQRGGPTRAADTITLMRKKERA
jgi:hypothetical protein